MSLKDLDLLLGARHDDPALAEKLTQPLPLEELITLAQSRGLTITEDDVFQAQHIALYSAHNMLLRRLRLPMQHRYHLHLTQCN